MGTDIADGKSDSEKVTTLSDYWHLLTTNYNYLLLFLSYSIDNIGNWFTFVACVAIIEEFGLGSLYNSIYLILRLLPSFLFVGCLGPIADKYDKRLLLLICSAGAAVVVALLLLPMKGTVLLIVLYVVTTIQFTFAALYEPVRTSWMPHIVSESELIVGTSLDGVAWSTVSAVGAGLGGFINSRYGTTTSFVVDILSYCVCFCLLYAVNTDKITHAPMDTSELQLTATIDDISSIETTLENGLGSISPSRSRAVTIVESRGRATSIGTTLPRNPGI